MYIMLDICRMWLKRALAQNTSKILIVYKLLSPSRKMLDSGREGTGRDLIMTLKVGATHA